MEPPPAGDRRGEKSGWILGWLGGFLWIGILAVVFLVQGRWLAGGVGLALLAMGVGAVLAGAPWRHPTTPYWKLMLPIYLCLAVALAWLIHYYEGPVGAGFNRWHVLLLGPLLAPFWSVGGRRWQPSAADPSGG